MTTTRNSIVVNRLEIGAMSENLFYRRVKWQVTDNHFIYELQYEYGITEEFHHPLGYYSVMKNSRGKWCVIAYIGCTWDGATKYPDFLWMMFPSLVHDILHWLIKRGVIHVRYNDVIDLELEQMIIHGGQPIPWYQGGNSNTVRRIRAKLILRATNTADEKLDLETSDIEIRSVKV